MAKLRLSEEERRRLEVLVRVSSGRVSLAKGADLLELSYRQMRRVYQRYQAEGNLGVRHGLKGRASNHRVVDSRRKRVLKLYESKYGDFGPTLAVEYLAKADGEVVGIETLRQWLLAAGLWAPRRERATHRKWRERKRHVGEMIQMDGSVHDWFEGRRAKAVLMVMIDDATNRTYARFFEGETTAAVMWVFWDYVELYGLPHSLYVDRDSIYKATRDSTVDEALADRTPETQFGRAMVELGVKLILAHSPQAKGRVERRHGVFQDRLVKGMRLAKIRTLEQGNAYLADEFLIDLNKQFTVPAADSADLHRPVPRGVKLERVLSYQEQRVVMNDWTVLWHNRCFQVSEAHRTLRLPKKKVLVIEQLDGEVRLEYRGRALAWTELKKPPIGRRRSAAKPRNNAKEPEPKGPKKPSPNHPWRKR